MWKPIRNWLIVRRLEAVRLDLAWTRGIAARIPALEHAESTLLYQQTHIRTHASAESIARQAEKAAKSILLA